MNRWLFTLCALLVATPAYAESIYAVQSARQRFVISGPDRTVCVELGRWLEDSVERFESLVGQPVPMRHNEVIHISLDLDASIRGGRVVRAQGIVDGRFKQKLRIINPASVDRSEIEEGLSWLLLNRLVRQSQGGGVFSPESPDWLSTGLAGNLHPEVRNRRLQHFKSIWNTPRAPHPSQLLTLDSIQVPDADIQAACTLFVQWLLKDAASLNLMQPMIVRMANHKPVDEAFLVSLLPGGASSQGLSRHWAVWMASRMNISTSWGADHPHAEAELIQLLRLRPSDLGVIIPSDVQREGPLTPMGLIAYRDEPWCAILATRAALAIRSLGLGQSPAWREVLEAYASFFDGLAWQKPGGWRNWLKRGPSERALRDRLLFAQSKRQQYQVVRQEKEHLLNPRTVSPGVTVSPKATLDDQRKMLLDRWEDRLE